MSDHRRCAHILGLAYSSFLVGQKRPDGTQLRVYTSSSCSSTHEPSVDQVCPYCTVKELRLRQTRGPDITLPGLKIAGHNMEPSPLYKALRNPEHSWVTFPNLRLHLASSHPRIFTKARQGPLWQTLQVSV